MTLLEKMKFRIESPEHSEAVQKALFEIGYKWYLSDGIFLHTTCEHLYARGKEIVYGNELDYFIQNSNKICSLVKGQIVEGDHPWDGFIPWFGGECPVSNNGMFSLIFRKGYQVDSRQYLSWDWAHHGNDFDIIAYKVIEETKDSGDTKVSEVKEQPCTDCNDYALLINSLAEEIAIHRQNKDKYDEAVKTISSEREANAKLTQENDALRKEASEVERLNQLLGAHEIAEAKNGREIHRLRVEMNRLCRENERLKLNKADLIGKTRIINTCKFELEDVVQELCDKNERLQWELKRHKLVANGTPIDADDFDWIAKQLRDAFGTRAVLKHWLRADNPECLSALSLYLFPLDEGRKNG